MTDGTRRRPTVIVGAVLVLLAAAAVVGTVPTDGSDAATATTVAEAKLVTVTEGDDRLWPYTSRQRDVETRTLPINVVVHADLSTTRRVLAAGDDRTWTTTDAEEEGIVVNENSVDWSETTGADRYTYVETDDGGRWLDESAQVHDGAYLGARYHLRLYEVPSGEDTWTAIQAHQEHWDWFRLRHTVGSTARARYTVEHEFYGTGTVADVSRERFGNGGALDADGWVTVFDLVDWAFYEETALSGAALVLLALASGRSLLETGRDLGAAVEQSRLSRVHLALFGTLFSLPLFVRVTAVTLERALPWLSPKVIAAPLYLVLAVGVPLVAGLLGRRLAADDAFATATVGLGLGVLLDYSWLGIATLPFGVVVHRLVLLVGLGLIAAGGVRWAATPIQRHRYRLVGVVIWVGALVWALAGL
ncbi:hypothetical protein [Halorarius litoreus]|uniref:hypothetical protein n=1 Tax=Halorarius litoreus TaxID=2962676 RepID=UPI0020CC7D27|nr:hypothetical protein [Halorarius litoreus]